MSKKKNKDKKLVDATWLRLEVIKTGKYYMSAVEASHRISFDVVSYNDNPIETVTLSISNKDPRYAPIFQLLEEMAAQDTEVRKLETVIRDYQSAHKAIAQHAKNNQTSPTED